MNPENQFRQTEQQSNTSGYPMGPGPTGGPSLGQQYQPQMMPQPQTQQMPQPQNPSIQQASFGQSGIPASLKPDKKPWVLIISLIVFVVATLISSGFAFWAYAQMQDYKNNYQEKSDADVAVASEIVRKEEEKKYAEQSKEPHLKYAGPSTFGGINFEYPKTWSAMVDESSGNQPINGYFHEGIVPGPRSGTAFALRLEVIERPYDTVLQTYDSDAKAGKVRISPFTAVLAPEVLGARVDGEVEKSMQGSAVLLPLRDKTIRISTLSSKSYGKDFNDIVLKTLDFTR